MFKHLPVLQQRYNAQTKGSQFNQKRLRHHHMQKDSNLAVFVCSHLQFFQGELLHFTYLHLQLFESDYSCLNSVITYSFHLQFFKTLEAFVSFLQSLD